MHVASSSRSQRAIASTTCLTPSDQLHAVRRRSLASAGIRGGCYSVSYSPTKGPQRLPRPKIFMPDQLRRMCADCRRHWLTPSPCLSPGPGSRLTDAAPASVRCQSRPCRGGTGLLPGRPTPYRRSGDRMPCGVAAAKVDRRCYWHRRCQAPGSVIQKYCSATIQA